MTTENVSRSAEELWERRRAQWRLRLMDVHEKIAVAAESAASERLRAALAARYRTLIGVRPDQRREFRDALENRINVTVHELVESFARD